MDRTPDQGQLPSRDVLTLGVPSQLVFDDDSLTPILTGEPAMPPTPASVTELWLRGLNRSDECGRAFIAVLVKNPQAIKAAEELDEAEQCLRRALDRCADQQTAAFAAYLSALGRILESKQQPAEAEALYRRALALQEQVLGVRHKDTLATGRRLIALLDKTARQAEARKLRNIFQAREVPGDEEYWQQNRLRAFALDMFLEGQYVEAESIYRRLADKRFELCSTHCHLARVYLMLDREVEAREEVEHACAYRDRSPSYAIVRMLFLKTLMPMLADLEWKPVLLELKQALTAPAAHMDWKMRPVLEHLQPRLGAERYDLMSAIAAAICDRTKLPELESNPLWQSVGGTQAAPKPEKLEPVPSPTATTQPPPPTQPVNTPNDEPSSNAALKFTFGTVVKVSSETITVKEYSFLQDANVEVEYHANSQTEFGNIAMLAELKSGDSVVLNFIESKGPPLLVAVVKEMANDSSAPNAESTPPLSDQQPTRTP